MILVELYSKDDCPLCDEAIAVLDKVRSETPFTLKVVKLLPGEENFDEFKHDFPVLHINKRFAFKHRLNETTLKIRLQQVANEGKSVALEDDVDFGDVNRG
ncbi:MAG: glutaredoxin family protein [Bacteroidetes bacterium]|nr:glutaredoxin family protein [Bacteroidota bacterium]MCW5897238.1 glutaredoxin family protein [Bacteroidota bacterium]